MAKKDTQWFVDLESVGQFARGVAMAERDRCLAIVNGGYPDPAKLIESGVALKEIQGKVPNFERAKVRQWVNIRSRHLRSGEWKVVQIKKLYFASGDPKGSPAKGFWVENSIYLWTDYGTYWTRLAGKKGR